MTPKMVDPTLGYLSVGISGHRLVQELPQLRAEALVGEVYEDVSLRMSDIKGAHGRIMRRFTWLRQRIGPNRPCP
jgi:hypothetical protein